jgi:two-component system sensor histidine kinase DesK
MHAMRPQLDRLGRDRRFVRSRLGPSVGLLFLIGPISDLDQVGPDRRAAILVVLALFVALYLALLPPVKPLLRLGWQGIVGGLALLAVLAGAVLALGAPQSFVALYVYFVAAAGMLLPTRAAVVVIPATALAVGIGLIATGASSSTVAATTLTILAIGAMLASLGHNARMVRELREAREELANLAVTEERLRIARDLHDLLGHSLSIVALKSELAHRLVYDDPDRARAELEDVQRVTRQSLAEVREAVQGYRRLAFDEAVDGARTALSAAGIDFRVEGSADDLPDEVESVLAWAVREATTNVVRHSGARSCAVTLAATDDAVALQVDDDGAPELSGSSNGAGLAGLAERARRLDGTLEAGARPGGGFRLRLSVPLRAA